MVRESTEIIREVVAPGVRSALDPGKPDGVRGKLPDVGHLHRSGRRHPIDLCAGLESIRDRFRRRCGRAVERRRADPGIDA